MVFVGYETGSKGYRMYDPVSQRVRVARDVTFNEAQCWNWDESSREDFTLQSDTLVSKTGGHNTVSDSHEETGGNTSEPRQPEPVTPRLEPSRGVEFATPPVDNASVVDYHDDGEGVRRFRTLQNLYDVGAANQRDDEELHLIAAEEPGSLAEAQQSEHWRHAMQEEMQSIIDNQTWQLVDLPSGQRPIGLKWVYKVKKDASGKIVKYKARLVAKGYVQRQGVDFDEVFAPVARLDSVRLLLALAAHNGWKVHHMDVKSAFLNGDLEEEVYVAQPPGFVTKGKEDKVFRLHKALYGLRQAPRAWNHKLDGCLTNLGFQRSVSEHAVYARGLSSTRLLVGVYVDDLVITGADPQHIESFKKEMESLFKMSDLGLLSFYLGIEVRQADSGITISQRAYAGKLLEKSGMTDCNPCHVPMEPRFKLSKDSTAPPTDATEYRSIVGSLRYLVHTRPDIAYAVGYVSRFMENPTTEHLAAVKHVLRYIAGTLGFGCQYLKQNGEVKLIGYSDSDMAGDVDTRKSTSGVLFFLNNGVVTWQSQKQKVVALSSCEAEYMAASTAACQGIWLARLLAEMQNAEASSVCLKIDNKSAISLSKNPVFHDRSKHIDTRFHFIRECVEGKKIEVEYIQTDGQLADILTKALGRTRFQELRRGIGMTDITQTHKD